MACSSTSVPADGGGGAASHAGSKATAGDAPASGTGGSAGGGATGASAAAGSGVGGSSAGAGGQLMGGTSNGGSSMGGQPPHVGNPSCVNPVPVGGRDTGYERCENGIVRRTRLGTCTAGMGSCSTDADCTDGRQICVCQASGAGSCMSAQCSTSDDCGSGFDCAGTQSFCVQYQTAFACQSADDACTVDADCVDAPTANGGAGNVNNRCVINAAGAPGVTVGRLCYTCGAAGRPFLVDAAPRTASTVPSSAWLEELVSVDVAPLTADQRTLLTAHWRRAAELEHASVAAFARFVLELLSLGAPAQLVADASRAQADEVAHARACYSVASIYAGRALGPAHLDIGAALNDCGLSGIVRRAVVEGCVGETLAAIEAGEAARNCEEPSIRRILERISEDEARHAELSWRFLRWVMEGSDSKLREAARDALADIHRELSANANATATTADEKTLIGHGVLPTASRAALSLRALCEVVSPCAEGLLATRIEVTDRPKAVPEARHLAV